MKKTYFKGNRSGNFVEIKLNTDLLEQIVDNFDKEKFATRVGILGSKTDRMASVTITSGKRKGQHKASKEVTSPQTNAEIGLLHEKGSLTKHIPRRSFLELPLLLQAEKLMFTRKALIKSYFSGDSTPDKIRLAYEKLGIAAENIIQKAFETGGYGYWPKDSDSTIARKHSSAVLIDTGQLRRSISSDVVAV